MKILQINLFDFTTQHKFLAFFNLFSITGFVIFQKNEIEIKKKYRLQLNTVHKVIKLESMFQRIERIT